MANTETFDWVMFFFQVLMCLGLFGIIVRLKWDSELGVKRDGVFLFWYIVGLLGFLGALGAYLTLVYYILIG
jgi:Ca2+/Na+ antiporter